MTRSRTILLATLIAVFASSTAHAYVEPLHRKITGYAFDRAASESDFLKRYQLAPISLVLRADMQYGSVHEDDMPNSVNHFFDYQNGAALKVPLPGGLSLCNEVGVRADRWALDNVILNPHSLYQAQNHFYMGLTEFTASGRALYMRDAFADLGHIVHLLQDMAQPEHTRNDQHLVLYGFGFSFGDTAASIYENWSRDRLVAPNFLPDGTPTESFFVGYPTIADRPYKRYFGEGSDGLAAFSSLYHVTQDTNYGDTSFRCLSEPAPRKQSAIPRQQTAVITVVDPQTLMPQQIPIVENVYTLPYMYDSASGYSTSDGYHTVESALDYETGKYDPNTRVFSLSEMSWKTRAANLIPRAVGYSASLIKHFFRGKINTFWNLGDDGRYRIGLRADPAITNAEVMIGQIDDQGQMNILAPLRTLPLIGFYTPYTETVAENPADPIYTKELRVVVRGTIDGEERTVVAELLPKRHKMKFVVEYDTSATYQQIGIQAIKQGTGSADCAGCSTLSSNTMPVSRGIPFSDINRYPFNGKIELTVGALDSDDFFVSVFGFPTTYAPKVAKIKVFRNDQQTAELVVPYTRSLQHGVRFKGDGSLTVTQTNSY